jgi:GT2 family glycosyltransferase
MEVDIVIVNWNAGRLLKQCLASLVDCTAHDISEVVVVDNASTDGSADGCEDFDLPIKVIRNRKNLGFAHACNQGAAVCRARYILFLNPDTRLFQSSLAVPIGFMENPQNSDVGICGIQLLDDKDRIARTCMRFPSVGRYFVQATGLNKISGLRSWGVSMSDWDHSADKVVDQIIGAFFFTRRSVFEELEGFDERFFVYFEEVDFSVRAKKAGWMTIYLTGAQAFHFGGGTTQQVKATRLFYSLRSRLLYGFKHFAPWRAWSLVGITLVVELFGRSVYALISNEMRESRITLRGLKETWIGYGLLFRWLSQLPFRRVAD